MMMAPSASASTPLRFPGQDESWPRVDDHLVEPETSRDEVVRGHRYEAMAANPEHADPHCQLDALLWFHVGPGHVASTDMLTRFTIGSNFAPDTSVRKSGIDPKTGTRYLEELAFEVVNEQALTGPKGINTKSEDMIDRGVRRVFGVFVKEGVVKEWRGSWVTLPAAGHISDACLARPLPVKALFDAAAADLAVILGLLGKDNPRLDDAAAQALIDKKNPLILQIGQEGVKEGLRRAVLDACELLGIEVNAVRAREIEAADTDRLNALRAHLKQHRSWPG